MNGQRATKVEREGINMTVDGALHIQKVRLRCTVNRINDTSPLVHFATLIIKKEGEFKLCCLFSLKKPTHSLIAADN